MNTIFVHGLGQTPFCWESTISYLPKQMVIECPNLFELCTSKDVSYQKLYAAFIAYCDRFTPPLNLCGISLGAILALNYAIDYPGKVNSLVTIAPQFKMPRFLIIWQSMIFNCLPEKYFLKSGVEKKYLVKLSKSMMNLNFKRDLKRVDCPVLVICGSKDYVNRKASKILANNLENANHYLMKEAGHEVNRDAPKSLALAIKGFYTKIT